MDDQTKQEGFKRYTMILVLSTFSRNSMLREYKSHLQGKCHDFINPKGAKTVIRGTQTNEAAVKYAIARLSEKGEHLERVICLCTAETTEKYRPADKQERKTALEKTRTHGKIPFEFFKTKIKEYCKDNGYNEPTIEPLKDDTTNDGSQTNVFDIGKASTSDIINKTIDQLKKMNSDVDHVILDITGGWRTTSHLLTLLARFLRMKGATLEFSVYSQIYTKTEGGIHDTDDTDLLYKYIEATTVFKETGNPGLLASLLDEPKKSVIEISDLIEAMNTFYNDFTLNKTTNLEDNLNRVRSAVEGLIALKNGANPTPLNLDAEIFINLISELLTKKLAILPISDLPEPVFPNYPALIKWCCDNNHILYALTLYTDKYPEFLFKKEHIIFRGSEKYEKRKTKKDLFKDLIYQSSSEGISAVDEKMNDIRKYLKSIDYKSRKIDFDLFIKALNGTIRPDMDIYAAYQHECTANNKDQPKTDAGKFNAIVDYLNVDRLKRIFGLDDEKRNDTSLFQYIVKWRKNDYTCNNYEIHILENKLISIMYDFFFLNKVRNNVVHANKKDKWKLTQEQKDHYSKFYDGTVDSENITANMVLKILKIAAERHLE